MKNYEVQVVNPMVQSVKKVLTAQNVIDAKVKASKLFAFKGDFKYIIARTVYRL